MRTVIHAPLDVSPALILIKQPSPPVHPASAPPHCTTPGPTSSQSAGYFFGPQRFHGQKIFKAKKSGVQKTSARKKVWPGKRPATLREIVVQAMAMLHQSAVGSGVLLHCHQHIIPRYKSSSGNPQGGFRNVNTFRICVESLPC